MTTTTVRMLSDLRLGDVWHVDGDRIRILTVIPTTIPNVVQVTGRDEFGRTVLLTTADREVEA